MSKGIILLSAGGTGGHLFPAQALAQELSAQGWSIHLATDERAKNYAGNFPAEKIHAIASATPSGKSVLKLFKAGLTIWKGYRQARKIIQTIKPAAVVGFGGYPTLPPLYAATGLGVPSIIHEQNGVMGRANKALAGRVNAIAGGFLPPRGDYASKIVVTGNPVRESVLAASKKAYELDDNSTIHLLVFGGSQGARYFSDTLPDAINGLPSAIKSRLHIVQQARSEDEARVKQAYEDMGISHNVASFFDDLPGHMADAHLVVARAGASTVLELAIIGRPSILVPLPHALDDDQGHNAKLLVDAGGALMRRQDTLDAHTLSEELGKLLCDGEKLRKMARNAKGITNSDATRLLGDLTNAIASGMSIIDYKKTTSKAGELQ